MTKSRLARNYAAFIRRANLTPDETGQFLQLMTERTLSHGRLLAGENGKDNANPAGKEAREKALQANAQYKARLEQLLGNERHGQFEDYLKTLPGRVQVENVMLAQGPQSFSDAQMDVFAEVFTNVITEMPNRENSDAVRKAWHDLFLKNIQNRITPEEMKNLSGMFKNQGMPE